MTAQDAGACISCGKPVIKVAGPSILPYRQGVWVHVNPADNEYCDEVAKPARVLAILDKLQAERVAETTTETGEPRWKA